MGETCQGCGALIEDSDALSVCWDDVNGLGEVVCFGVGWWHPECMEELES
jgi:hypothetical protein